jgi:gliding motility-associated-like protein
MSKFWHILILATELVMGLPLCTAGQNVLRNGSFEVFQPHYNNAGTFTYAVGVEFYDPAYYSHLAFFNEDISLKGSCLPGYGVPNTAYGFQYPRTGRTMVSVGGGTSCDAKAFKFREPLIAGKCYLIRYYVSRWDISNCAMDAINGYFSKDSITLKMLFQDTIMPQIINPLGIIYDTMQWIGIEQKYIASGWEKYFTIGNFFGINRSNLIAADCPDSTLVLYGGNVYKCESNFCVGAYFLDDVAIWECGTPEDPADAGPDREICLGDQVEIGNMEQKDQYLYLWSDRSWQGPRHTWDTLATTPKFTVSPTKTTTYYLWSIDFKWEHTYDSVTVFVENCNIDLEIPNVFTPNSDGFNDYFIINNPNQANYTMEVYNRWGNLVFQGNQNYFWDGNYNGEPSPAGTYFYVLKATTPDGTLSNDFHGSVTILR